MRKIAILLTVAMCIVFFVGCVELISERPINAEYVAAYDAMETIYDCKFDWLHGEFKYLPELKMVHHPEEYKVQYEQIWSDGTKQTYWVTVSKAEYENALQQIEKGGK